jgi:hypothetical protein
VVDTGKEFIQHGHAGKEQGTSILILVVRALIRALGLSRQRTNARVIKFA